MKEKVNVTGVPETMVQTLYARAKETKKQNAKIKDEIAVELVKKLDYDFSIADKDKAMNYGVIARTIVLDRMVEQYLKKHENAVVVNLACGLDTRCYRMKGKYLRWYNVDLPETMEIRRQFLPETGPIYQIAKSAMDDSYVDDIDYHGENVLVIIEGLTMYLVSAKYSCGFSNPQISPIIATDRYLDYFTTIMEDRLWQVLASPVFRWWNRSDLSMNAVRAA